MFKFRALYLKTNPRPKPKSVINFLLWITFSPKILFPEVAWRKKKNFMEMLCDFLPSTLLIYRQKELNVWVCSHSVLDSTFALGFFANF